MYEYRSSNGRWYCRLCWKNADDAHVLSRKHANNVRGHVDVTPPAPPAPPVLPAPPPPAHGPWRARWCFEHERPYYHWLGTEQVSWDLSAADLLEPAPAGGIPGDPRARWGVAWSAQCQQPYFWNLDTRETRWAPLAAAVRLSNAQILSVSGAPGGGAEGAACAAGAASSGPGAARGGAAGAENAAGSEAAAGADGAVGGGVAGAVRWSVEV